MPVYARAPLLGKPLPVWLQERRAAEAARPPARRTVDMSEVVVKHPPPYLDDPVTPGAVRLEALAASLGMRTQRLVTLDACTIEGIDQAAGVGFRVTWRRGRAARGTWHERERRWGMVHDERPGPDATVERRVAGKTKRIPDPKRRPRGLDPDHLVLLAGPHGVDVGVTEVTARLKALAE